MAKEVDAIGLNEKVCATCGKTFYPAPMHVFKRNYGRVGRTKWFCKYTCMLAWDREHPQKYTSMK